jgi:hypoxanthine phosphoribosyltransferase
MMNLANRVVQSNALDYVVFDDINIEKRIFVSWDVFEEAIRSFCLKLKELESQGKVFDSIYSLPRGGLCLGVKLSYLTGLPLITSRDNVTSKTLVVDDCTDTGRTLSEFRENVTFVMFHKPTSCFRPSFYFQETDKQINFCWESVEERN